MNNLNFALVISILKNARDILWDGVTSRANSFDVCEYVCVNVDRANKEVTGLYGSAESRFIKSKILDYMDGAYTYDLYYATKTGIPLEDVSSKALQDGRYEMIDALIAHATPLAILQNAKARLWDGDSDGRGEHESVRAMYVCHAITYATVDVLGLSTRPPGEYGWGEQDAACSTPVAMKLHSRVLEKIGGYSTAGGFYQREIGDYTMPVLQAFRANLLAEMFAEFSEKTGV